MKIQVWTGSVHNSIFQPANVVSGDWTRVFSDPKIPTNKPSLSMTPVGSQLVAYVVEAMHSKKPCLITHKMTNFSERAKLNGLRTTKPFDGPKVTSCLSLEPHHWNHGRYSGFKMEKLPVADDFGCRKSGTVLLCTVSENIRTANKKKHDKSSPNSKWVVHQKSNIYQWKKYITENQNNNKKTHKTTSHHFFPSNFSSQQSTFIPSRKNLAIFSYLACPHPGGRNRQRCKHFRIPLPHPWG